MRRFLLASLTFLLFLPMAQGQVFIDSPENVTYNVTAVDLNVSSVNVTEGTWNYSLDGESNVTFTPNTTLSSLADGQHNLTVFVENVTNNTYGSGIYGQGKYGQGVVSNVLHSSVLFTIRAKRFIIEIYALFEIMAFILLLRGLSGRLPILNFLLAMGIFLTLSVQGFYLEPFDGNVGQTAWEAVGINFGLGLVAFMLAFLSYMGYMRKELEYP